jgi:death-on-curing protein
MTVMPLFLTVDDLIRIHGEQVRVYGGEASVRDLGLLESAAAMPALGLGDEYLHKDLFEMAAAYLFHVVQNHPFADGNKRTGTVAALAFLELNGVECDVENDELAEFVLHVARGLAGKAEIAEFFRAHAGSP